MSAEAARAALDAARRVLAVESGGTAPECWRAAANVLQTLLDRPALTGHALVSEARNSGYLKLADAHALVTLISWSDQSSDPPRNETERSLVKLALLALEHAVPEVTQQASGGGAAAGAHAATANGSSYVSPWDGPPPVPLTTSYGSSHARPDVLSVAAESPTVKPWRKRWVWPGVALLLLALGGSAAGWWVRVRPERQIQAGIAAYERGAREVARSTFTRFAAAHKDDARPLIYLGRMSREDGDLAPARSYLTDAVRLDPGSALAARELASVMLADKQPDLARRFYTRALELAPEDRLAQGFLGCALAQLGRMDEAQRWIDRAGPGEWEACRR